MARQRPHLITWENFIQMLDEVPAGMFDDDNKPAAPIEESFPWRNDPLWRPPDESQELEK